VLQALEELHLLGKVQVIATDLFQELVPLIESGKVLATMYQRPYTQGKVAFESLLKYLLREGESHPIVRLPPHIVLRSNLAMFSNQVASDDEEIESELER
jgi:LacI family transcriptional regulator